MRSNVSSCETDHWHFLKLKYMKSLVKTGLVGYQVKTHSGFAEVKLLYTLQPQGGA